MVDSVCSLTWCWCREFWVWRKGCVCLCRSLFVPGLPTSFGAIVCIGVLVSEVRSRSCRIIHVLAAPVGWLGVSVGEVVEYLYAEIGCSGLAGEEGRMSVCGLKCCA